MNTTTEIKPDIRILKLDESHNWDPEIVSRAGGKIFGVYLYDATVAVHCCEITPSYELNFIESQPHQLPDDEDEREKLYDDIQEGDLHTEPVLYYHKPAIDRIEEVEEGRTTETSHRFKLSHLEGHEWGETSNEAIEEALDWVRCNSV